MPERRKDSAIVPIERALDEFRAGRMIILMDDEDRENEGDLCVAADRVTAEHINFMATYGRGLVCLALTETRCDQLGLPMMVRENRAPLGTAFTVSIEARPMASTSSSRRAGEWWNRARREAPQCRARSIASPILQ